MKRPVRSAALSPLVCALLAHAPVAHADGEAWEQFEYRLPIVRTERPTWPRVALRVYTEAREAGRFSGLYDSYLRIGPLVWVAPFLVIGAHGTFEGTRTAGGCAMGASASCGQYVFEFRAELEPNFFGRFGPITINDRNRIEMRWRESGVRWRYRNQLRVNYQPVGAVVFPFVIDEVLFDLTQDGFNQNRATAGVAFQINPTTRIDVGYMFRSRLVPATAMSTASWEHDHIGVVTLLVDVPSLVPAAPTRAAGVEHASTSGRTSGSTSAGTGASAGTSASTGASTSPSPQ